MLKNVMAMLNNSDITVTLSLVDLMAQLINVTDSFIPLLFFQPLKDPLNPKC